MKRMWFLLLMGVLLAACARSTPEAPVVPSSEPPDITEAAPAVTEEAEVMDTPVQVSRTVDLPFIPHDIAVDSNGNIFAVELGAPKVHKLDRDGAILTSWGEAGAEAGQFAFDPPPGAPPLDGGFLVAGANGNVYVTDSYNNRVQVFDSDGNYIETISAAGEIAFDSNGNLFTTVAFEGIALKIPAGGGEPAILGGKGTEDGQFMTPMWVEVGADDTVYISDHSGRVQLFNADGSFMAVWSDPGNGDPPLTGPSPLSQDSEGNIYIATKDRNTVYVLHP